MTGDQLYAAVCEFLSRCGWRRVDPGSGWWWHERFGENTMGEALDEQLLADGIDLREEPVERDLSPCEPPNGI